MKTDFHGISCLDIVNVVDSYPSENTKTRATKTFHNPGGFATNAAITHQLLGGDSVLHAMLGQDNLAQDVKGQILAEGIDLIDYAVGGYEFPVSTIILNSANATRTIFSSAKDRQLPKPQNAPLLKGQQLFIDGFFIDSTLDLISQAKAKTYPVIFDADKWRDNRYSEIIPDVDCVIAGSDFFPPNCTSSPDVFQYFISQGVENIAMSDGENDIVYYTSGQFGKITPNKVNAVDTLGAGDVLHGAFCFYYPKYGFIEGVEKASRVATQSCQGYGIKAWSFIP